MAAVTIAIPCHNEAEFLEETVRSLMVQTETDLEIFICDNGSTDATPEIARRLAAEDDRIHLDPAEGNIGGRLNFIRASRAGTAPFFMWAGAHDLYDPGFVAKLLHTLREEPAAVLAFSDSVLVNREGGRIDGEPVFESFDLRQEDPRERFRCLLWGLRRCDLLHGLMRREWIDIRPMERVKAAPDLAFLPNLAFSGKFVRVPELLFFRRQNRGVQTREEVVNHLMDDKYVDASTSHRQILEGVLAAHLASIDATAFPHAEKRELVLAAKLCFEDRYGIPFDIGAEAGFIEKLRLKWGGGSKTVRKRIHQDIRNRLLEKYRPVYPGLVLPRKPSRGEVEGNPRVKRAKSRESVS